MKIGKILRERMDLFDISVTELSEKTFIDESILKNLRANKYDFEMLDEYDKALLADALFCSVDYFLDEEVRSKDFIFSSINRGAKQDKKAQKAKCRIYRFVKNYIFVKDIINGGN